MKSLLTLVLCLLFSFGASAQHSPIARENCWSSKKKSQLTGNKNHKLDWYYKRVDKIKRNKRKSLGHQF